MSSKKIACRKCFSLYAPGEFLPGCKNEDCPQCAVGVNVPLPGEGQPDPLCDACGQPMSIRLCPNCGFPLLADDTGLEHLGISIVGSEGCGKSHFLSVLIDQLRNQVSKSYDCSLYPVDGDRTLQLYDQQYYQPLFVRGECIHSTPQDEVEPLVYSLIFSQNTRNRSCSLALYDACGANFLREHTMSLYNRSIYNARGILLLVDPSQLQVLKEEYLSHGLPVREGNPEALLSRTIHLIREGTGKRNMKQKINIPLAVCLTKIDTLEPKLDPSSFLRYSSRHLREPIFDRWDYESCSMEVQSLMEAWGGRELLNQIASQFSNFGFFGFSSLGAPPSDTNRVPRVAPHRVTDPLLWILWQNKIIHAGNVKMS